MVVIDFVVQFFVDFVDGVYVVVSCYGYEVGMVCFWIGGSKVFEEGFVFW